MNEHHTDHAGSRTVGSEVIRPSTSERERRRWRRGLGIGAICAIVFHLLLFLMRTPIEVPAWSPPGPGEDDRMVVVGGGSAMQQVEVQIERPETAPEEEPEEFVPVPEEIPDVEVEIDPDDLAGPPTDPGPPVLGAPPGAGESEGESEGPERGEGGASDGDGEGAGGVAPRPIRIPTPPTGAPSSARGERIAIHVFVDARGQVVPDSTRLEPATRDRRFNARLRQHAQEMIFEPARRNGRAVAAWFRYVLEF